MVDDEPICVKPSKTICKKVVSIVRCSVTPVGWELMQQNTPDLVISDIMMQVDGYQFQTGADPVQDSANGVLTASGDIVHHISLAFAICPSRLIQMS